MSNDMRLFPDPTRKLSYHKDDRAMRPLYGCPENFRESLSSPTATFAEIFNGLLLWSILWMCVQNLKIVALPNPEIIGVLKKYFLFSDIFNGLLFGWTLWMYLPNLKFVALPVREIIAIAVLGWVANPQSWGRGGRRGSGMVPFERALVSSYRPSILTFHLSLRVSEILPLLCSSTSLFPTPPLVSPKFSRVPLAIGGWPLSYEERTCCANCPCN